MKKIKVLILALAMAVTSTYVPAMAENTDSYILRYDFENLDGTNAYNLENSEKYPLSISGPVIKNINGDNLNYPMKKYVESTSEGFSNFTTTLDSTAIECLNDGFSVDTWFNTGSYTKTDGNLPEFSIFGVYSGTGTDETVIPYVAAVYSTTEKYIRVPICVRDSSGNIQTRSFAYSCALSTQNWYHFSMSYNPKTNEPPIIYVNGAEAPCKANGFEDGDTRIDIPSNGSETVKLIMSRGFMYYGQPYDPSLPGIGYASFNLYNENLLASDLIEKYNITKTWFEPEFNMTVTDGLGIAVASTGLDSIYKAGGFAPKISIDMQSVSETDASSFTTDTVKIYNAASNTYVEYTPQTDGTNYIIPLDRVSAGAYRLEISGIKNTSGDILRESIQTLEFTINEEVLPTLIASYDMKDRYNKVNSEIYPLGEKTFVKINDNIYDDTYRISGGVNDANQNGNVNAATEISGIAKQLSGSFIFDAWVYNISSGEQKLFTITRDNRITYKNLNYSNNYMMFNDLYRIDNGDGTYTDKIIAYGTLADKKSSLVSKWNHIVFEYVPNAEKQIIYINGTKNELTRTSVPETGYSVADLADGNYTLRLNYDVSRGSNVTINGLTQTVNWGGSPSRFRFSNTSIYTGASSTFTNYLSTVGKEKYEASPDLKLYKNDVLIEPEALNTVTTGNIVAKISGLADPTVLNGNIRLRNRNENYVAANVTTVDGVAVADFGNVSAGTYTLVVDKSVNGRTTDYELDFTVASAVNATVVNVTDTSVKAVAELDADITQAVLILASYNSDGIIKDIALSYVINNNAMETEVMTIETGDTCRAFLWDSFETMHPLK